MAGGRRIAASIEGMKSHADPSCLSPYGIRLKCRTVGRGTANTYDTYGTGKTTLALYREQKNSPFLGERQPRTTACTWGRSTKKATSSRSRDRILA